jgi:hypothetical protein
MLIASMKRKTIHFACLLFFAVFSGVFAGGTAQKTAELRPLVPPEAGPDSKIDQNPGDSVPHNESIRARQVMKALAAAYPDQIGPAQFRGGDWAVPLAGDNGEKWFYYAEGRLLPEELRDRADEFDPLPFYTYAAELPPWKDPGPEDAARFREMSERRRSRPPKRSQHFFDELWRAHNRDESWDRVKSLRFLGRSVLVHYSILEELSLVEELILAEAKTNPQVRQWINSIDTLDGWNWRSIVDTQSRSYHAYGAALDFLPKNLGGRETYWIWASRRKSEWWTIPYEQRYHPPQAVIKAFESYGFVWGGKWLYFDTMHFEYRPEIFILSDLPLLNFRSISASQ